MQNHRTALVFAAMNGHNEVMELLLSNEAHIDARDKVKCVSIGVEVMWSNRSSIQTETGSRSIARVHTQESALIQVDCRLSCALRCTFAFVLFCAGSVAILRNTLDMCTQYGNTPLLLAALNGHTACVTELLNRNATIEAVDKVK